MKNKTDYSLINSQLRALIEGEEHVISCLSNAAALLWQNLDEINWAGFYLIHEKDSKEELLLAPFQGKPACVHIQIGKGVCGTAVEEKRTLVVENVHEFKGHIACDCASNSEIVVPIFAGEKVVGVLDIDSPVFSRFDSEDAEGLSEFVKILEGIDGFKTLKY